MNPASQTKREQMILKTVQEYEGKGYKVYADIEGYPRPSIIGGHRPDVLAVKGKHRTIVEVETLDSLKTSFAAMRGAAFQRAYRRGSIADYKRVIAR